MCQANVVRVPVKIKRKSITVASDNGRQLGKWFPFPKPDEQPPTFRTKKNERVLWCPWCGEWTIYKKKGHDAKYMCTGVCGWGNTEEFYVRSRNNLWFENVPLSELKKITIPAPAKRRR